MILPSQSLRELGIERPWTWGWRDAVRFSEIDRLGHVNNAAYAVWLETLRVHWFIESGLSSYGPDDPFLVVRRQSIDYLAEMRFPQEYVVIQHVAATGRTSFTLACEVRSGGTVHARGEVVVVQVRDGAKAPLSRETLARLT